MQANEGKNDDADGQEESSTIGSGLSCTSPQIMEVSKKTEERKASVSQNASIGDINERSRASTDSSKLNKQRDKDNASAKSRLSQRQKKPNNIDDLGYVEKKFKVIKQVNMEPNKKSPEQDRIPET